MLWNRNKARPSSPTSLRHGEMQAETRRVAVRLPLSPDFGHESLPMISCDQVHTFEQLRREGQDPVAVFEEVFRAALESAVHDLASTPYYVRERSVVNLFVFGHLVPKFQEKALDIRQICIEEGMQKHRDSEKAKHGRYADVLVWPHQMATLWRTCKPLAVIEWKNISCREKDGENPSGLKAAHKEDIEFLNHNADLISIGYAVLSDQRNMCVKLECKRVSLESTSSIPVVSCSATYQEYEREKLRGVLKEIRARKQACPSCIPT